MTHIVEVNGLQKQYDPPDGVMAVKDVSFHIEQGEIFSLLGPNGAGKTTTISMLSCLFKPTGGDAIVAGHSINQSQMQVKSAIGVVPQEIALYPTISARENLSFWGKMAGLGGDRLKKRMDEALEIAGLSDRAKDKVEEYSGGMKRRLNIAVGLLHEPQLLYMDEPTVGIDPQSRRRILDTIKALNESGLTVLYTTHYMEEAQELSDRVGIMDQGELIALGTQAELTRKAGSSELLRAAVETELLPADIERSALQLDGVKQAVIQENELILQTDSAHELLPAFIAYANQADIRLRGIEVVEPNLEALFLQLTGRALRD